MGLIDIAMVLVVLAPIVAVYTVLTEPTYLLLVIMVVCVVVIIREKLKERERERMASYFPESMRDRIRGKKE